MTSDQNPTPASVQFILRTQEISAEQVEETPQEQVEEADEGVLGRIINIFKQLYTAVSGVFAQN